MSIHRRALARVFSSRRFHGIGSRLQQHRSRRKKRRELQLERLEPRAMLSANAPPENTVPSDIQDAIVNQPFAFTAYRGNQISIADTDAAGNLEVTLAVDQGFLTLINPDPNGALTYSEGNGTEDATMIFQGTAEAINTALSWVAFVGDSTGPATVTITTDDSPHMNAEGESDTDTIQISVGAVPAFAPTPTHATYPSVLDPEIGAGLGWVIRNPVGTVNRINDMKQMPDGTFVAGENIRTTKIAYKDRAGGLFTVGDTITGVTSGATFEAIGSNTGLKWIFADAVTGSFTDGEYVTNSTTANQNGVSLSVVEKYARLSGSKSIKFPATGYLVTKDSYDFSFGNTADFTVQGWVRADNLDTTQHLFDFRRLSATSGLRITLQTSGAITVYNGTSQLLTGGTLLANNWHHIAVVRTTSVLQLYVDGVQVGGNYADTNDYGYAAIYIGADFNGANQFTGYMDNVVVKNGESDFNTGFTPPTQINYANQYVKFGLDGEQPFIIDNQETYAIYTGQRISSAAVKELNYDQNFAIIENVDLGRSDHRNCADIIDLNAAWIAEEAVGRMKAAFPDFTIPGDNVAEGTYGGTDYCIRDTKDYIIGALVKDLRDGGNYNSLYTARTYLEASGKLKHVGGEILQTLYAWDQAFVICKYVITTTDTDLTGAYTQRLRIPNNFSTPASQSIQDEFDTLGREVLEVLAPNPDIFRDTGVLIWKNRDYIAEEVAGYILDKYEIDLNGTATQLYILVWMSSPNLVLCSYK